VAANLLSHSDFAYPLISLLSTLSAQQRVSRERSRRRRRALTVLAVSSVALLLWQARKVRRAARVGSAADLARSRPARANLVGVEKPTRIPAPAPLRRPPSEPRVEVAHELEMSYPPGVGVPWLNQAALAIQLQNPGELRRIGRAMRAAGHDIEAGLLGNYALLLERSAGAKARILTEVTRLLEEAAELMLGSSRGSPRHGIPPPARQDADAGIPADEAHFTEDSSIHRIDACSLLEDHAVEPLRYSS
jgi:hypothetical protein